MGNFICCQEPQNTPQIRIDQLIAQDKLYYSNNNNPNNVYLTNNFVQQNKAAENYQRQPSVKSLSNTKLQYLSSFRLHRLRPE